MLVRNTTRTASRDGTEGAAFAATTFYDGQGMMVTADSGITGLDDMDGATVCVLSGTTTEQNLATVFNARGPELRAAVVRRGRPDPRGDPPGPVRRLDVGPLAAGRAAVGVAGRPKVAPTGS